MTKNECQNCDDRQACVPFFEHENAMEHMKQAHKITAIVAIVFAIAMVAVTIIFVTGYTSRTKDWLSTYVALQKGGAVTEVTNGVYEQSSP